MRTGAQNVVGVLVGAFAASLVACTTPPTSVLVVVDTDAPLRVVALRTRVSRGASMSAMPATHNWLRDGSAPAARFPASFGIVPGGTPNDGTVSATVEIEFSSAIPGQPNVTVRRNARFRFTPHTPGVVRLFLPIGCAAIVTPPARCSDTTTPCTVSRFCEEQSPAQTCGEDGTCVTVDTMPVPLLPDGGLPAIDAATRDATDATSPTDVPRDTCVRTCTGRMCGNDSCGGTCGSCGASLVCNSAGQCVSSCTPNCAGRVCGDDGCGGSCGSCGSGQSCDASGQCVCVPNCVGRVCGNDGCGGSCGSCGGQICNSSGQCVATCTPSCAGRSCGDDGCSGSCGSCGAMQMCNASGQCVCAPNCVGRSCGPDGCGGSCGTCSAGNVCNGTGQCIACAAGSACDTGNPCVLGSVDCASGGPVCTPSGNAPTGTPCAGGTCNGSGSCTTCGSIPESCDGRDNNCNGMVDEGAGCSRTVDVTAWTPDRLCLSTYDDFRSGPDFLCQEMGYLRSTGTYNCVALSCSGDPIECMPAVDARHNMGWFTDTTGGVQGQGWCFGNACITSIDCVIP